MAEATTIQRILFGSPGTGKSHKVHNVILKGLGITDEGHAFKTVFHPEYKYGDFMGRLTPNTENGQITYHYKPGIFMRALAKAYSNLKENVALVIDEINRGNSAAIFGTVFQLLDREGGGWSSYDLDLSDLEFTALMQEMGYAKLPGANMYDQEGKKKYKDISELGFDDKLGFLKDKKIKLPPNLSIVATMNTSDESIYYMDSAFKRRWDWEFVPVDGTGAQKEASGETVWEPFRTNLNKFILDNADYIRNVEDKQIGPYFLKPNSDGKVSASAIQSKLLFFLWDSVFQRSKEPLAKVFGEEKEQLRTFGEFASKCNKFIDAINAYKQKDDNASVPTS